MGRNDWISCDKQLPEQVAEGEGKSSELVHVLLSNGEEDDDFLINNKWVLYCNKNGSGIYPVAWKEIAR